MSPKLTILDRQRESSLLSAQQIQSIIEHERARTDRNGQAFSLLTLGFPRNDGVSVDAGSLAGILRKRLRFTDVIGLCAGEQEIVAVLPDTDHVGANKLAKDLAKTFESCGITTLTYPKDWGDLNDQDHSFEKPPGSNDRPSTDQENQAQVTLSTSKNDKGNIRQKIRDKKTPMARSKMVLQPGTPNWKRIVDMVGSFAGMTLLAPLFLMIAILIKVVSRGPIFIKQVRLGQWGKPFTFWKFRTMHADCDDSVHRDYLAQLVESDTEMVKLDLKDDPRIIPFGKILRQTSLDELPQLANVLMGHMSLVGPRPCFPYEAEKYQRWHWQRFVAKQGMTGLWQVSGKNETTFKEMIRLDIGYTRSCSPRLDLKILLKTVPAIIRQIKCSI